MKPTLFILAAGMSSRYGELKQLDGVGRNGATIMDYSIYDAVKAGFGKVVFVIRHSFEKEFRNKIIKKYENRIAVDLVFQELDYLPKGFALDAERTKPWGTNHAILMAKDIIKEPFAVINADDFYGQESFKIMADFLIGINEKKNEYCLLGYKLNETLSDNGAVTRAICETDKDNYLTSIIEYSHIIRDVDGFIKNKNKNGELIKLDSSKPVSMNMFGFTPDYFQYLEKYFINFLYNNKENHNAEFYITLLIEQLIASGTVRVKVLNTPSKWFGVTYVEDRPSVVLKIKELTIEGKYPEILWQ